MTFLNFKSSLSGRLRPALTLVELIIALLLVSLIVLGAFAFDIASRKFLQSSETSVDVLNDLTFVLEHMQKNVLVGIGDVVVDDNRAIKVINDPSGAVTLQIRQDQINPATDTYTPWDYSDDRIVTYVFNPLDETVSIDNRDYDPHTVTFEQEILINKLTAISLSADPVTGGVSVDNMVLRYDPAEEVDPRENPEAHIEQQFFFPLSQSLS
jgi:hypothetical protein